MEGENIMITGSKELHKTPIPQILRRKFSDPESDEKPLIQKSPSPKLFAQGYLF